LSVAFATLALAQDRDDTALVNRFFPQRLIDDSINNFRAGGPSPFRACDFVVADLDGKGVNQYLVAAYTNGFSAVVRVIRKSTATVVDEPPFVLMLGIFPRVRLIDLEGNGRADVVVTLSSAT